MSFIYNKGDPLGNNGWFVIDNAHECAWLRQLLIFIATLHNGEDLRLQRIRLDLRFLCLMGLGSVHNSCPPSRPSSKSSVQS